MRRFNDPGGAAESDALAVEQRVCGAVLQRCEELNFVKEGQLRFMDLLRHGAEVEVIWLLPLRAAVSRALRDALDRYEPDR